ncbi:hypothetical protein DAMA08_021830 [Martiniozyma asiatica (nom. inval.)]|nr:hypothetical protein DAMA08_021830 [Martiniozyma asiatica]
MQIKDILKSLLDDDLVKCEKCGISNIYWSFPYADVMTIENRYINLLENNELLNLEINSGKNKITKLIELGKGGEEWDQIFELKRKLQSEITLLETKWADIQENSADKLQEMDEKCKKMEEQSETMIDNSYRIVNYLADLNGTSKIDLIEYFNLPSR